MTWSCTHPIRPWLVIGLVLPVLTGCVADAASGVTTAVFEYFGGDGETRIEAEIAAAEDLNPDYNGDASPLVVRLYQLSSPTAFNNATFFQLYDGDVAVDVERLIRDLGGSDVDWSAGTELVRQAAAEATDADDFRGRMQRIVAEGRPGAG